VKPFDSHPTVNSSTCREIRTCDGSRCYSDADESKPQETVAVNLPVSIRQPDNGQREIAVRGTARTIVPVHGPLELLSLFVRQLLLAIFVRSVPVRQSGETDDEHTGGSVIPDSLTRSGEAVCRGL